MRTHKYAFGSVAIILLLAMSVLGGCKPSSYTFTTTHDPKYPHEPFLFPVPEAWVSGKTVLISTLSSIRIESVEADGEPVEGRERVVLLHTRASAVTVEGFYVYSVPGDRGYLVREEERKETWVGLFFRPAANHEIYVIPLTAKCIKINYRIEDAAGEMSPKLTLISYNVNALKENFERITYFHFYKKVDSQLLSGLRVGMTLLEAMKALDVPKESEDFTSIRTILCDEKNGGSYILYFYKPGKSLKSSDGRLTAVVFVPSGENDGRYVLPEKKKGQELKGVGDIIPPRED